MVKITVKVKINVIFIKTKQISTYKNEIKPHTVEGKPS